VGRFSLADKFFGDTEKQFCSGTVVAVNVVLTAAHCLYWVDGFTHEKGPIRFRPGFWGSTDYGVWEARSVTVWPAWRESVDAGNPFFAIDYGFVTLEPNADGQNIGDVVGWKGIIANYTHDMWSFGYPATGLFFGLWGQGEYPYYCHSPYEDGHYTVQNDSAGNPWYEIGMGCYMTGGSSGGPWFTYYEGGWDYVASVNSHCAPAGCKEKWAENMWGPYFTQATIDLFEEAKNA
jgi:hypothetical protein